MKKKFLSLFLISVVSLVFAVSCSDEEEDTGVVKIRCNSNADCNRNAYCDLDNPQQDAELGMLVYYCKQRQLCSTQADCPIKWKCKISEGFCITDKEASQVLCSSDTDCSDPAYPKCNLASGECEPANGGGGDSELPDSSEIPDNDSGDSSDSEPDDTSDTTTDNDPADSGDDGDTDTGDAHVGETVLSEDFEDGGTKWTIVPASEEASPCWEIGAPTTGPAEAHEGSNVAATSLGGNYADNCNDLLKYNTAVSIPSTGVPEISFYAWVDLIGSGYSPYDYVEVLVKKDGEMWETTTGVYLSADTPSPLSALDNTKTKITKQLGTAYYKFTGDLSAYKGKSVEIGFRFISDESDNKDGFYLDDIKVSH
ncbi:choice-of-anchor J domain-containing protein [bacterium]|nr:choice-of-anchor J domain-containing protein [bacterium]MBP5591306.1 choice-of-anchor J domain-containing protein [bacterium]